jgi:glycyl-tRNA synthetase beta chain
LSTLLFHKKLGTYKEKAERIERLARWIAAEALGADETAAGRAALAGRLSKVDLTTDMVREFTELQGTMGGIYAREEGLPEEVWRAIYFQYLPVGVEPDAPPSRAQLGKAATTWAAVSLADKLDTIVGLFAAGEKPTGSRDPYGLRRAAQGVVKMLVDLPIDQPLLGLVERAFENYGGSITVQNESWRPALFDFMSERENHLLERRGFKYDELRAVTPEVRTALHPYKQFRQVDALAQARKAREFEALAVLFKRVKNITRDFTPTREYGFAGLRAALKEPAELALLDELEQRWPRVDQALTSGRYLDAMNQLAPLHAPVDRFFTDVLVMADDAALRDARLALLNTLRDIVFQAGGDISEIAPAETKQV